MKKILILFFMLLTMGFACAEVDFNAVINETSMPTDGEIRAVIEQFNFDDKQKEQLFKDTKKSLQDIYSGKNKNAADDLNNSLNALKKGNSSMFKDPNMKAEFLKEVEDNLPKK